jgi:glycosyltransferase involved in cell wall biosynthesis
MENKPLVSVCMITYNHEAFISQAIEGILMQKANFPIELIIGEDCSNDRTREICLEYQQEYPEIIRILPREKNFGMTPNFVDTLKNCRGKYIALCEGDDYWTDKSKLQKQVDFLEANPDFAICFHRVKVVHENIDKESYLSNPNQKEVTAFEDLTYGNYIHTLSCVFRNNLFEDFPYWFKDMPIGDYPLHLLNAQYGKIKFFEETMGVYRIHKGGIWGHLDNKEIMPKTVLILEQLYQHFYPGGREQFGNDVAYLYKVLAFCAFEDRNYKLMQNYYLKLLKFSNRVSTREILALTVRFFLSYSPFLAQWYKSIRSRNSR